MDEGSFTLDDATALGTQEIAFELDSRETFGTVRQAYEAPVAAGGVGEGYYRGSVQITVRGEELVSEAEAAP
jgi:hypothetical protein